MHALNAEPLLLLLLPEPPPEEEPPLPLELLGFEPQPDRSRAAMAPTAAILVA
jgi:hypothetical protein